MTLTEIKALIRSMAESGVEAVDFREGAMRLRIVRGAAATPLPDAGGSKADGPVAAPPAAGETTIEAPLSGTFYSAESPGKPPFVDVGATVGVGDTVGLIEAMKMLTPVKATAAGIVAARVADNGAGVEAGDVLFTLASDRA